MLNLIYANYLKTKRTYIRLITLILPLIYSLVMFIYLQILGKYNFGDTLRIYCLLFSICMVFCLGFYIPMIYSVDKAAGNYAIETRSGINRKKIFISKFLFIQLLLLIIVSVGIGSFSLFNLLFNQFSINILLLAKYIFILIISASPIIVFYQFTAIKYNYTGTLLLAVVFVLSAILMGTTGLGGNLWKILPWIWPVRLFFEFTSPLRDSSFMLEYNQINEITYILIKSFLFSIFLLTIQSIWFEKWEGSSSLEE